MELREVVTENDARDVVEIMQQSLFESAMDENGVMDMRRMPMGTGMSKRSGSKTFVALLTKRATEQSRNVFSHEELYTLAQQCKIDWGVSFVDFLESLNHQGYLLKKGGRNYQLTTTM
jgi:DNA helicase MCM8